MYELLFLVVIVFFFWLVLIRPQQRRAKAQLELQRSLQAGQRVMLTSGVFGTLVDVESGDNVTVELAPGVVVEVVRGAIAVVVPEAADEPEAAPTDADAVVDLDKRADES
ncbi:MAG: preprotein translocase subunit YajC [Nocardioides alkalitolerans]